MLKLEKNRNKDVNVTFRTRDKLFNRTFIYAMSLAVGMHLLAALIFQIHAFLNPDAGITPPIMVHADLSNSLNDGENRILANLDENDNRLKYLSPPPQSTPDIPQLSVRVEENQIEYVKEASIFSNPFTNIEEDWEYLTASPVSNSHAIPGIKINVSGELAEIPLIEEGTRIQLPQQLNASPHSVIYAVQVEGKTGRVFWQMKKTSDEKSVFLAAAEAVLNEMRFQKNENIFVCTGEVEIVFQGM